MLTKGISAVLSVVVSLWALSPAFAGAGADVQPEPKWQRLNGNWAVVNSELAETRSWTKSWNYYPLLDYNSVVSLNDLDGYKSIDLTMEVKKPSRDNPEAAVFFAVKSPEHNWFYYSYAVSFKGDQDGLNTVSLLKTSMKDETLKPTKKGNGFTVEIAAERCSIPYGKPFGLSIRIEEGKVSVFTGGKRLIQSVLPDKSIAGRIAIGGKNAPLRIKEISVSGSRPVFSDTFESDTIYAPKASGSLRPGNK